MKSTVKMAALYFGIAANSAFAGQSSVLHCETGEYIFDIFETDNQYLVEMDNFTDFAYPGKTIDEVYALRATFAKSDCRRGDDLLVSCTSSTKSLTAIGRTSEEQVPMLYSVKFIFLERTDRTLDGDSSYVVSRLQFSGQKIIGTLFGSTSDLAFRRSQCRSLR